MRQKTLLHMLAITKSKACTLLSSADTYGLRRVSKIVKKTTAIALGCILAVLLSSSSLLAQTPEPLRIRIISENEDQDSDLTGLEKQLKEEVEVLLLNRRTVTFKTDYCDCDASKLSEYFDQAFADSQTDIVIGLGPLASAV